MTEAPGALQLRLLQTVVEVAAEKTSTLVMPLPVELLRFFERSATSQPAADAASSRSSQTVTPPASRSIGMEAAGSPERQAEERAPASTRLRPRRAGSVRPSFERSATKNGLARHIDIWTRPFGRRPGHGGPFFFLSPKEYPPQGPQPRRTVAGIEAIVSRTHSYPS